MPYKKRNGAVSLQAPGLRSGHVPFFFIILVSAPVSLPHRRHPPHPAKALLLPPGPQTRAVALNGGFLHSTFPSLDQSGSSVSPADVLFIQSRRFRCSSACPQTPAWQSWCLVKVCWPSAPVGSARAEAGAGGGLTVGLGMSWVSGEVRCTVRVTLKAGF